MFQPGNGMVVAGRRQVKNGQKHQRLRGGLGFRGRAGGGERVDKACSSQGKEWLLRAGSEVLIL